MSTRRLILDDDIHIGEAMTMALEREGRTIFLCRDVETAQLVVEQTPLSHVVTDVKLTGLFGFEGLDFIDHVKRHAPAATVILMTGSPSPELEVEARSRGAVAFLTKPFDLVELESLLGLPDPGSDEEDQHAHVVRIPTIGEIVVSPHLSSHFQPIVRLDDPSAAPYGFEALARFQSGCFLDRPDLLFEYAARKNQVADLEIACIERAIQHGRELDPNAMRFINLHPAVFDQPQRLVEAILAAVRGSLPCNRLVLEITEQRALGPREIVLEAVYALQAAGVRFAFDDVGMAYSHLKLIEDIRPAFLKISQHFGTNFENDETRQKIVRNILSLARDFDSQLILEGIESAATADRARALGIPFGQGYHFAYPAEARSFGVPF
jgi:EAL domain-containing protein (putative c-di-GMP-specific phosphodiesterase class I)